MNSSTLRRVMRPLRPEPLTAVEIEPVLGREAAHGRRQPLMARRAPRLRRSRQPLRCRGAGCRARRVLLLRRVHVRRHRGIPRRRRRAGALRRRAGAGAGGSGGLRGGRRRRGARAALDDGEHGADLDRRACRHADLRDDAGAGRRNLHRDLVGLDVEDDFVGGDCVADLLVPIGNGALGDGLAELRHQYVHRALSVA